MGRKAKIEQSEQARARQMAADARDVAELRMAQAIVLPGRTGRSSKPGK